MVEEACLRPIELVLGPTAGPVEARSAAALGPWCKGASRLFAIDVAAGRSPATAVLSRGGGGGFDSTSASPATLAGRWAWRRGQSDCSASPSGICRAPLCSHNCMSEGKPPSTQVSLVDNLRDLCHSPLRPPGRWAGEVSNSAPRRVSGDPISDQRRGWGRRTEEEGPIVNSSSLSAPAARPVVLSSAQATDPYLEIEQLSSSARARASLLGVLIAVLLAAVAVGASVLFTIAAFGYPGAGS